jgi:ABC-type amino acid transport substrate-binding protein
MDFSQMFRTIIIFVLAFATQAAAAGVLERVAETKTLRLGYRTDTPPFSAEPNPGERVGYSLDLCRAVAGAVKDELKLRALVVQYVPVGAENRFDMIEQGKIDLLCGATTVTLSRRARVDFSLPIFVDGASVIIGANNTIGELDDLAGLRLAVRAGTTTEQALRASFPDADILTLSAHQDGIKALLADTADAYFADRTLLQFLRAENPKASELQIAEEYLTVEPYALALPLADTRFRLLIDRTISTLYVTGQIDEIAAEAFGGAEVSKLVKTLYQITPLPE